MKTKGSTFTGRHLKLTVYGASHAPAIGMRLENFPAGFTLDRAVLQALMERRAPGRNATSTARFEPDVPEFISGLADGVTTGEPLEAVIRNTDTRPKDYGGVERTVPRPGHADYGQWIQRGRIPTGGGPNSGRLTAPMCIAGGVCQQYLVQRGIIVSARAISVGGQTDDLSAAVLAARDDLDSVGGIIEITATGLPPGIGGAMFDGVETVLSGALFGIPGVKGVEFGAGFKSATMRGSELNDPFVMREGRVETATNNHGGILGGMTSGMPLVCRIAMKPTPSIFKEQRSVDLLTGEEVPYAVKGRHDPCITLRAVPVAEAITAFALADAILAHEAATPRICLTLGLPTLAEDLAALARNRLFVDLVELRVDKLTPAEREQAASFPTQAGVPTILTIRRPVDGGSWEGDETTRAALYAKLLAAGHFAYVDFEDDFRRPELTAAARAAGTRVIRSLHDFSGPVVDVAARCRALRGESDEIAKVAFMPKTVDDVARLFAETADFTEIPHILCAMGPLGAISRILACRTHSFLTFTSPAESLGAMKGIGHLTPRDLVRNYNFRSVTSETEVLLEASADPAAAELRNATFAAQEADAIQIPMPVADEVTLQPLFAVLG